ncbi:LCP family protein [Cohnella sp. JJ-181]|uniref:LCP family protein n=1 Tax=Cohnella rhizoplanae TaxID=2974897 RepID=UPI0022FFB217|nr:LCP family protein [Cohnella sp. JJ-181]CAI6019732.1 Polyisoprenyl-teichoic acid--peptidoglycan teichoic acid transferase TagU [Cohnella sp. JJ-181]
MSSNTPLPPRRSTGAAKAAAVRTNPPKKKKRVWLRLLTTLILIVIVGLGAYAYSLWRQVNGALDDASSGAATQTVPSGEKAQNKPIALLLLGMDYRPKIGTMNTDVVMVAAFNPKSNTATVVTIPRDSDLQLEGYSTQKINAFYARFHGKSEAKGDAADAYARDEMKEMLGKFFDIDIHYASVLKFQGFVDIVDKLGGVKVNVDKDMRYVDNADGTNIDLEAGEQTLRGEDALGFVRYRKSNRGTAASSDFERNERQSQVLGAIVDKMKSFGGLTKLGGVIDVAGKNLVTDIPKAQITNMLKTYYDINREDIRFLPLTGVWKSPYVYLDDESVAEAKAALAEEMSPEGRSKGAAATDTAEGAK